MRLATPFVRLPLLFDAACMAAEVSAVPESAWRAHPQGYAGNSAVTLVGAWGDPLNDQTRGPMRPTPHLQAMPYVRQVMAALGCAIGRSRLMRIDGNGEATLHVDTNYYWATHVRIHIPVVTTPDVEFICRDARVHMATGDCWIFDTWSLHNVINPAPTRRIHLVCDSVGSPDFWALVERGQQPTAFHTPADENARRIEFDAGSGSPPAFELCNQPVVMSPYEVNHWARFVFDELHRVGRQNSPEAQALGDLLRRFAWAWTDVWTRHGILLAGHDEYRQLLARLNAELDAWSGVLRMANGADAVQVLRQFIVRTALNPEIALPLQDDPDILRAALQSD